jgi:hypothetical protein
VLQREYLEKAACRRCVKLSWEIGPSGTFAESRNTLYWLQLKKKKLVSSLFCWRQCTAATVCSLQLYSTEHPAADTTLTKVPGILLVRRLQLVVLPKSVYFFAQPSSLRAFCVTRTNGIRSVWKTFTSSLNSRYQILELCMHWTTKEDRVCYAHFAKHKGESLSSIQTSILIAVWKKSRSLI